MWPLQSHSHILLFVFSGVLGGTHDWWCYGCSAVWLHAVSSYARPLREACHTEGHPAPRGWGPAGDQGGAHWAQDTGSISLQKKIGFLTPIHHPSRNLCPQFLVHPQLTQHFCTHTSSLPPHMQTQIPNTFVILVLHPELDLLNYSKGASTALTISPNFTCTHPSTSSSSSP